MKKRKIIYDVNLNQDIEIKQLSYDEAISFLDTINTRTDFRKLKRKIKSSKLYVILKIEHMVFKKGIYDFSKKIDFDNKKAIEYLFLNLKRELIFLFFGIFHDDLDFKIKNLILHTHNLILEKTVFESFYQVIVLNCLRRLLIIGLCENFLFEKHKDNPFEIYYTHYEELKSECISRTSKCSNDQGDCKTEKNDYSFNSKTSYLLDEKVSFIQKMLHLEYKIIFDTMFNVFTRFDNILNFYKTISIMNSKDFLIYKLYCLEPFLRIKTLVDGIDVFILLDQHGYKYNRITTDKSYNLYTSDRYKIIRPTFNYYNITPEKEYFEI